MPAKKTIKGTLNILKHYNEHGIRMYEAGIRKKVLSDILTDFIGEKVEITIRKVEPKPKAIKAS